MRGKRFEETRPGRDVCLEHYVRADKSGTATYAFSRIWDHHTGKSSTVTADNLPTLLPDAYPYLIRIMLDVHGWDAVCLHKTVWRIMVYGMVEHLLQPLDVKVRKGFSLCFFPCLYDSRRFLMSRSPHCTIYGIPLIHNTQKGATCAFPSPTQLLFKSAR